MSDSKKLIDILTADCKPVSVIKNSNGFLLSAGALIGLGFCILFFMGIRPDYQAAMQSGVFFWKPGIFVFIWIFSLLFILKLSRPHGRAPRWAWAPLLAVFLFLILQFKLQLDQHSWPFMVQSLLSSSAWVCFGTITGGGLLASGLIWYFWLRRTASASPAQLGFWSGVNVGTLAAAAYAVHCPMDTVTYIFFYYCSPIFLFSALGIWLGKAKLHW